MANFQDLTQLIESSSEADFVGEVPETEVILVEQELGVKLPVDYRDFLLRYGCGNFGGEEIFGAGVRHIGIPSVIWATKQQRSAESNFPIEYVVIYNAGLGELGCLDTGHIVEGKSPVISWMLGLSKEKQKRERLADSFVDFAYRQFEDQK